MTNNSKTGGRPHEALSIRLAVRDAVAIALITSVIALLINLVHPNRIAFIAEEEYETLVPCPEPGGEVTELSADNLVIWSNAVFVVDARSQKDFEGFHFRTAINVTYDYLEPTPEPQLKQLAKDIARSGAQRVVVYGDGDLPDTGEQLGKEISGFGIKNVCFVKGGAPALESRVAPEGKSP
jgi:hypothetical protein